MSQHGDHQHGHGHDCGCGGHHHHQHHHHHNHEHSCGCGGDHHHQHDGHGQIFLTMEDGREVACDVLDIFEVKEQGYIAVLPEGEEDVFIYRFKEEEDGPHLSMIEDEEEFELVSQTFLEMFSHDHGEEDEA